MVQELELDGEGKKPIVDAVHKVLAAIRNYREKYATGPKRKAGP